MFLNHYLAQAGICSRRKAVELIKDELVTVNGVIVSEPTYKVQPKDSVKFNGKLIKVEEKTYILLNKPKGYVSSTDDEFGRKTIFELIPLAQKKRLFSIGRLDRDTTGLIVLTNDGQLAQDLGHPRHGIQKVYEVTLDKPLLSEHKSMIKKGIRLRDGLIKVDSLKDDPKNKAIVFVTLHSGKKRVIRRLFAELDYDVKKLDRIRFAGLTKKGLKPGMWRLLSKDEVSNLLKKS
ncbi:MAG: pseudouridine synthase [Candidatus Babeliales bacterium]